MTRGRSTMAGVTEEQVRLTPSVAVGIAPSPMVGTDPRRLGPPLFLDTS
jgi:hypothetical protein